MENFKIEDVGVEITPHKEASSDYCIMTLHARINKKPCKESIAVDSRFLFEEIDDNYREQIINDIIYKLSYDMITKSFIGVDKIVGDKINKNKVISNMKKLYKNNS